MAAQISSTFDIIYENSGASAGTTTIINPGRTLRVETCLVFAEPGSTITVQKNDVAGAVIATSGGGVTGGWDEPFPPAPIVGGTAADAILAATDNFFVTSSGGSLGRLTIRCVAADGEALIAPDMVP